MFWLLAFSQTPSEDCVPPTQACVPQNPGVRQISLATHVPLSTWTQPLVASQLSVVHELLSSQLIAVCTQPLVASQVSVVHALESSHEIGVCTQPLVASQVSV